MTDCNYQQTKRILLGQERMDEKYVQLADYIQKSFSVQVINVTCTQRENTINLTLWFKYENEENMFYKEPFVVDSRKMNRILRQFKRIMKLGNESMNICLSFQAFETLAKVETNKML